MTLLVECTFQGTGSISASICRKIQEVSENKESLEELKDTFNVHKGISSDGAVSDLLEEGMSVDHGRSQHASTRKPNLKKFKKQDG